MNFDDYDKEAAKTDKIITDDQDPTNFYGQKLIDAVYYYTLGLSGEAGEIANKIKKIKRDGINPENREFQDQIASELGDCLWYISRLARAFDYTLSDIAYKNRKKLQLRDSLNLIHGSGDDR